MELGIGGHLRATLAAGPILGGAKEGGAKPLASVSFDDVPAFDVTNGARAVAVIGAGAQAGFQEPRQGGVLGLGHKDDEWEDAGRFAGEDLREFLGVVLRGRFGPQRVTQTRQLAEVGRESEANARVPHEFMFRQNVDAKKRRDRVRSDVVDALTEADALETE